MKVVEIEGQKIAIDAQIDNLDRTECEESLAEFIKQAWHVIEPGQAYVHGWHIDFICKHLEAITDGVELSNGSPYNRLLINIPPGTMKSLISNVFWPAWEWGPCNMPYLRYVCAAHKVENLSARDSRRMRQLITSQWYQDRWGDRVSLARDQNEKLNFQNQAGGFRIATAITSLTGIRGDRVIIDDPHSVDSAASEAMREAEVATFLEAIPTRLNNPIESAIVVIMQRLHEEDVSGVILDKNLGYDHIMLPMRYDPSRAAPTMLGEKDERTEPGQLLFPERFPLEVVERDEKAMGPYATAGQFQQEPMPRGGGVIKREYWQLWEHEAFPPMDFVVAALDTAYTTKTENDLSALTIWGVYTGGSQTAQANRIIARDGETISMIKRTYTEEHPRLMLMYAWQERLELHELVMKVEKTMRQFNVDRLLIENKAAGISVAQEIRRMFGHEDFAVQLVDPKGVDKLARLYSIQHLFAEGLIYAPDRSWADMVINQTATFPKGKHDDLCLVGETSITMADGSCRPLASVRKGDMVATPAGPRRVLASSLTGIRLIWRLEFDGGFLEGTDNHPVFANGEWKPLASLCPSDTLTRYQDGRSSSCRLQKKMVSFVKPLSSTVVSTDATLIQKIQRTAVTLHARAIGCIETFGNFITAQFQRDTKSITLMATPGIMTSQILNACLSKSIGHSIVTITSKWENPKNSALISQEYKSLRKLGIKATLVGNGIGKMLITPSAKKERPSLTVKAITRVSAIGAALVLKLKALRKLTVQPFALSKNPNICAVKDVRPTHTMRLVYNLTVEGEHCYFANGILTHNCDTVSMAVRHVRELGLLVRSPERLADVERGMEHVGGNLVPLYDV